MNTQLISTLAFLALSASVQASNFSLSSAQFKAGEKISTEQVFNGFGCEGNNISPSLSWKNPPEGTRSFAITVYDPDAPTGSGWWHWVVFNIPADITSLPKGAGAADGKLMPAGSTQSRTDYGVPGYGGPCPPTGDEAHRYQFTVYALNTETISLGEKSPAAMVGYFLNQHALGQAVLEGRYGR